MRLHENIKEQDLEVVTFWVKKNMRAWPVDEDGDPLDENDVPFKLDKRGNIEIQEGESPTGIEEGEETASEGKETASDGCELPDRVQVWVRMLLGRDHNEVTNAMIKTQTERGKRGRRRAVVKTDVDLGLAVALKLEKAIVRWEGIEDEVGQPAPVTRKYIDLLPAWIQNRLTEVVNEMSTLDEELEGE